MDVGPLPPINRKFRAIIIIFLTLPIAGVSFGVTGGCRVLRKYALATHDMWQVADDN